MEQEKEYYAFISYKREDEKWAKWLQDKLEHYRFPTSLNGRSDLPKHIRPTFRDVTDLKPGLLAEEINNALRDSEWLIVVCSPRSAKSPWVCKEAQTFIDLGRADHIIPFVIEGTPFSIDSATECFPEALLNLTGSKELLAANINEMGRDAAVIKVVARMFGLRFDALWQRYEREKRRRRLWIIGALVVFGLISLGIAGYIAQKNKELEEQHALVLKSRCLQSVSLIKSYISQNRPEMALPVMRDIERDKSLLDSANIAEYQQLLVALCDSILTSNALLVDVVKDQKGVNPHPVELPNNNKVLQIKQGFDETMPVEIMYIHDSKQKTTDSIVAEPSLTYQLSRNSDYIAVYAKGREESTGNLDLAYSPDKTGIRIYSLVSGERAHFVGSWGTYAESYPMSISNDGEMLIFREGHRGAERTWLMDFKTRERTLLLGKSYCSNERIKVSFSPDDNYFCVQYLQRNTIDIYSSRSKKKIRSFYFDATEEASWNTSNDISIVSDGYIYVWDIRNQPMNRILKIDPYIKGAAISHSHETAAAICDNGNAYVWDVLSGKCLFAGEFLDGPEDIAISNDDRSLWAINAYDIMKMMDLSRGTCKDVVGKTTTDTRPCESYLYMTQDGRYCISCYSNELDSQYDIFDMNGSYTGGVYGGGLQPRTSIGSGSDSIVSEFSFPQKEHFNLEDAYCTEPVRTIRRASSDGEWCIEGYSDGTLKFYSQQEKERIESALKDMLLKTREHRNLLK